MTPPDEFSQTHPPRHRGLEGSWSVFLYLFWLRPIGRAVLLVVSSLVSYRPGILLRLRTADIGAARDDFAFHRFLHISAHCSRSNLQWGIQRIHLEDVVMVRVAGGRRRSHVLGATKADLIGTCRYGSAFGNRCDGCWNVPDDPMSNVVRETSGRNRGIDVVHDQNVAGCCRRSTGPAQLR